MKLVSSVITQPNTLTKNHQMKDELNFETRKFSECNNEKHLSTDELSTGYTIKEMMNGTFEITGAKYTQCI